MFKYKKYKLLFVFLIISIIFNYKEIYLKIIFKNIIKEEYEKKCNLTELYEIESLFVDNITVNKNSVLIIETTTYHFECSPGFSKYFIDLGYNVDIIIQSMGISSFCFFGLKNRVRIFFYEKSENLENYYDNISLSSKNYKNTLIQTTEQKYYALYQKLNFNQTLFVFHFLNFLDSFPLNMFKNNQIIGLGNFPIGKKINPHYFGDFKPKIKNKVTKFFITSTIFRNYTLLIIAAKQLKKEKKSFHVIVVGKIKTFSSKDIPTKLINNFTFKYHISFYELYKDVYNSDYIIINLDQNMKDDIQFNKTRVTGSAQLSYGFLKPVLINQHFSKFYDFNSSNSIIYNHSNFTKAMRDAVNMDTKNYKKIQENLSFLEKEIYLNSLINLKHCIN